MTSSPTIVAACRALHTAIDRLDQIAADTLGISRNDLRCLNILEHGPLAPTDIAGRLSLSSGSVTALLDRLEALHLIRRDRDPDDRRALCITATQKVFEVLAPVYRSFAEELERASEKLPAARRRMAIEHLDMVTRACLDTVAAR